MYNNGKRFPDLVPHVAALLLHLMKFVATIEIIIPMMFGRLRVLNDVKADTNQNTCWQAKCVRVLDFQIGKFPRKEPHDNAEGSPSTAFLKAVLV